MDRCHALATPCNVQTHVPTKADGIGDQGEREVRRPGGSAGPGRPGGSESRPFEGQRVRRLAREGIVTPQLLIPD